MADEIDADTVVALIRKFIKERDNASDADALEAFRDILRDDIMEDLDDTIDQYDEGE